MSECYYFNVMGYLATDRTTPDGYQVDSQGRWIINNQVQTRETKQPVLGDAAIYEQAMAKTAGLNSFEANAKITMDLAVSGMTLDADIDMSMKAKDLNSGNIKYLINMKMDMLGESIDTTAFYTDGYYYMDMYGSKFKIPMPSDEFIKTAKDTSANLMQDVNYLRDVQLTSDGQGNQMLTFNCDPESSSHMLNQMSQTLGQLSSGELRIKEYYGSAVINAEGYCISTDIVMKYEMVIEGERVSCDLVIGLTYVNPGQSVDFVLPSTEGYIEY